jgi:pyruvate dehydrogenase E1 component beta subunit
VLLEPRVLYGVREEFDPDVDTQTELGQAEIARTGEDVTIVALGQTVAAACGAADQADWSADVIDLLTVQPWDRNAVLESVAKTGRLVVVEESPYSGGWGASVVAEVASQAYQSLRTAPFRITAPDVPVPFGQHLEEQYVPSAERIAEDIGAYLESGTPPRPWWEGISA